MFEEGQIIYVAKDIPESILTDLQEIEGSDVYSPKGTRFAYIDKHYPMDGWIEVQFLADDDEYNPDGAHDILPAEYFTAEKPADLPFDNQDDPDELDEYDDDGYYDPLDDEFLDDDSGYFDFYAEYEDIIEGEIGGRYIGPGSDTLPESEVPPVWVNGLEVEPVLDTETCDGCGEVVTTWCSRCYCGKCCCTCGTHDEDGDGNQPAPRDDPPGRWNMPLTAYILL